MALDRLAALEQREVGAHFLGGLIAFARIELAGAHDDGVEFGERRGRGAWRCRAGARGILAVAAGAHFVEHLAQAVEIGSVCPRLRAAVAFRPHERARGIDTRHQPDVRQFGHAAHEDDVGWLDVAMHQPVPMQMRQRACE